MTDFTDFGLREKEGWSDAGIVAAYVDHFVPITDRVGAQIVEEHIASGERVLDLCCGQGTLTAMISDAGARVAGLDFSPEMIAKARKAAPNAEIEQGDAMAMPYDDARFDKVVCNFGMMHISDQPKALSEIRRVLKPGGEFIMATWVGPGASPAFAAVFGPLKAHADFSAAPAQPDLFAFAVPEQADEMIAAAGLDLVDHKTVEEQWILRRPAELFEIFLTATVGAGMLIRSQTEETIEAISKAIATNVRDRFQDGSKYKVPVPVAVISARAA